MEILLETRVVNPVRPEEFLAVVLLQVGRPPREFLALFREVFRVRWPSLTLPLLTRELIEQSNRPRTYQIRVAYAVLLYAITGWMVQQEYGDLLASGSRAILTSGAGQVLFETVLTLQFAGIYLFLPAMVCSSIASEKERETLGLLLITKLGPWTILFEKLLSRLVPMIGFLLLSLPLLAIARSLGGITNGQILWATAMLLVTMWFVGTFSLMWSALLRTTAGAFLMTYISGAFTIVIGGPLVLWLIGVILASRFFGVLVLNPSAIQRYLNELIMATSSTGHEFQIMELFYGQYLYSAGLRANSLWEACLLTVPVLTISLACLMISRVALWRRAFLSSHSLLAKVFQWFDKLFLRLNQNRVTRGIVLAREGQTLPETAPVAWRETTKKSLGTTRYLFRITVLMLLPLLPWISMMTMDLVEGRGFQRQESLGVFPFVWPFAALLTSIHSTGLISSERNHQTLDVLLSTAMTSREIVAQKLAGVWKLCRVLCIPFGIAILYETWNVPALLRQGDLVEPLLFVTTKIAGVGVYLGVIVWTGFWLGLIFRSRLRALMTHLMLLFSICATPMMLSSQSQSWLTAISPIGIQFIPPRMLGWVTLEGYFLTLALHFTLWTGVLFFVRDRCYRQFARDTGRLDPPVERNSGKTVLTTAVAEEIVSETA